jgi:hypothetical protein
VRRSITGASLDAPSFLWAVTIAWAASSKSLETFFQLGLMSGTTARGGGTDAVPLVEAGIACMEMAFGEKGARKRGPRGGNGS